MTRVIGNLTRKWLIRVSTFRLLFKMGYGPMSDATRNLVVHQSTLTLLLDMGYGPMLLCRSEVVAGWFELRVFFVELFLTFKAASMFHHAVDVVLELHPASGGAVRPHPATVMRARLVSPFARNF